MDFNIKLLSETHYNELKEKIDKILNYLEKSTPQTEQIGKWIPEKKAQELTGKKATTLWKMRMDGRLTFTKINNKVFYDKDSILALMDKNAKQAFK